MYVFEIHKDLKILYSSTHLLEGFLFSSATCNDIAKKQMSHFFLKPISSFIWFKFAPKWKLKVVDDHLKLFIISETEVPFEVALFVTWE